VDAVSALGLLRSERGANVIEMAIVLPLLLLLILGIAEFGFLFQRYVVLTNAAVEGARVATLPGYSDDDAIARVQSYADNGGIADPVNAVVTVVALPGAGGGTWPGRQVTATHVYTLQLVGPIAALFGGAAPDTITLTARSTMRSQVAAAP
jgi:Flp pilus assembly protein TadG